MYLLNINYLQTTTRLRMSVKILTKALIIPCLGGWLFTEDSSYFEFSDLPNRGVDVLILDYGQNKCYKEK